MIDVRRIRPTRDNVLVQLAIHARQDHEVSAGGVVMVEGAPKATQAVRATVIAAGPGHYHEKWLDHERGMSPDGRGRFVPMNPAIKPGARVMVESAKHGDRIWGDDTHEYRMVLESNIIAVGE